MSRPEHLAPPEIFYNETEAKKYASSSRMQEIQTKMAERAVEMLALPDGESQVILDIGCGAGLSGDVLTDLGHKWVGIDIASAMIDIGQEMGTDGDMILQDMGQGLSFRTGMFDGAISISAVQWLCNADRKGAEPAKRLSKFFNSLYRCLARGARAVLQIYPDGPDQMGLITSAAMRCGFSGGLVVDFPNSTKAKKYFLCLFAGSGSGGGGGVPTLPKPKDEDDSEEDSDEASEVAVADRTRRPKRGRDDRKPAKKSRSWVLQKKQHQRTQGKSVRPDSKYTGRKRHRAF